MISIRLVGLDYSRIRFAASPLWESVAALRAVLASRPPTHSPWVSRIAKRVRPLPLPGLRQLVDPNRSYLVDFLAPPPEGPEADFEAELTQMLETPSVVVARELSLAGVNASRAEAAGVLDQLGEELRLLWRRGVLPDWPELHSLLARDILFRGRQLAREGIGAVLAGVHSSVSLHGNVIRIVSPRNSECTPRGRGIVLVPSVFAWPDLYVVDAPPWRPTIAYPARGVALMLEPVAARNALARFVGARRAQVLLATREGATTGDIATALRVTAGAVSQQLTRLRAAGLIESMRAGRFVLHELTERGEAVLAAFETSDESDTAQE
jgi:DNA-binding transcriptional ArsR family regulator